MNSSAIHFTCKYDMPNFYKLKRYSHWPKLICGTQTFNITANGESCLICITFHDKRQSQHQSSTVYTNKDKLRCSIRLLSRALLTTGINGLFTRHCVSSYFPLSIRSWWKIALHLSPVSLSHWDNQVNGGLLT